MVFSNNLLMGAGGQASGYEIEQSIRFNDDDSAYLSRTPGSAGNRKTWTLSWWVKRGVIDVRRQMFVVPLTGSTLFYIEFDNGDGGNNGGPNKLTIQSETGSGTNLSWELEKGFSDVAGWYHFVVALDTTQSTANNRLKCYVNGVEQTDGWDRNSTPGQNEDQGWNTANEHQIGGRHYHTLSYFDGYLSEIHFIDGTALTASSFGETNSSTGQWVPINYSGSYGTNGFYLKGQDSSALGDDSSGNGNDFSSSGMSAADQVTDTPTDNHCVLNALDGAGTLSDGNLVNAATTSSFVSRRATIGVPSSGKWAFRVKKSANNFMVGVMAPQATDGDPDTNGVDAVYYYDNDGTSSGDIQTRRSGSKVVETTDSPAGIAADTFMEVLIDKDNNRLGVVIGGTAYIAVDSGVAIQDTMTQIFVSTEGSGVTATVDFGQSGFTPSQTGYKALSTANLDDPTIVDPTAYFQSTLYTGNGSTQSINQAGNSTFQPDWVWIKNRDAADAHVLTDAVRGATKILASNATTVETTDADTLTAFESDGFALGDDDKVNTNTEDYVAWQWKANGSGSSNTDGSVTSTVSANTTAGFSICKFNPGGNVNITFGHGLGVAPRMVIVKNLEDTTNWQVLNIDVGVGNKIFLNATNAATSDTNMWQNTAPTSTVVSVGTSQTTAEDNIAYCFAEVEGFSKIGSFEGNGSTDGPFVYTGLKPRWIMIKRYDSTESWPILDTARASGNFGSPAGTGGENPTAGNDLNAVLVASTSAAEEDNPTGSRKASYLSNGFKVRTTNTAMNASGGDYLYLAFAESPFKTATAR